MSISDENTNELDSYGVWVKNTSEKADLPEATENTDFSTDDSLDLPDFDNEAFSSDILDDFSSDLDTTLSPDELANITNGSADISVTEETPSEDFNNEEISIDDFNFDETPEDNSVENTNVEETATEESFDNEPVAEETPDFEVSESAFDISEPSIETEETPSGDSGEEEISLDDFMDGGFSDESVAAGNNGFEEGKGPSAIESEEVSLDDFVDMSDFDNAPAPEAQKEEIIEEGPIDMDISFDESADTVETEENISVDNYSDEDDEGIAQEQKFETEEVSLDDFSSDLPTSNSSEVSSLDTEDVDLSDFGIDAEAEETPIVQDVEEAKNKEAVVDYDLSIGDENTSAAPVVNEIKTSSEENDEQIQDISYEAVTKETEVVSTSLLQQIVNDLSGLKEEINQLKSNLAEIKANEKVAASAPVFEDSVVEQESDDIIIPDTTEETTESSGGFFDLDDTDDTIALSGDELNNIFNSAEFSEVPQETISDTPVEETSIEETSVEEPVVETTSEDLPDEFIDTEIVPDSNPEVDSDSIEETFFEETTEENVDLPDEIEVEESDFSDSAAIEENIFEETPAAEETISTQEFDIVTEEESIEDKIEENIGEQLDSSEEISFDYENENLEEPSFEEEIATEDETELPDEISIPKENDILVETNNDDFMDSVKDTTEIEEEAAPIVDSSDNVAFDTVDSFLGDEETVADEPVVDEPVVEESETEEPVIEETSVEEPSFEPNFNEVDNLDSKLSDSNIDYLTTKNDSEDVSDDSINSDLKKDIKSVLLYMDQLLENLPEEKIVEFAKSDEFSTYKKLFTELGLS